MQLLNIRLDSIPMPDLLLALLQRVEKNEKTHIVTVNPEFVVEASQNKEFADVLQKAEYALIDGVGMLVAIRYLQTNSRLHVQNNSARITAFLRFCLNFVEIAFAKKEVVVDGQRVERITGVDLIYQLVQQEWMKGRKVYLLGGMDNVSAQAVARLKRINPDIIFRSSNGHRNIAGYLQGNADVEEQKRIVADIANFSPDILLVGYGHPWQDLWISRTADELPFRIAIGVGGAFDYISGRLQRAPAWMRSVGLEWLYRLIKQPQRKGRIKNATWKFAWLVIMHGNKAV